MLEDLDPAETREWLEALDSVLAYEGADRAFFLLDEVVTEELGRLNAAGMDGMIMGFLDYNEEMKYFGEHVLPLMKQAGLRHE